MPPRRQAARFSCVAPLLRNLTDGSGRASRPLRYALIYLLLYQYRAAPALLLLSPCGPGESCDEAFECKRTAAFAHGQLWRWKLSHSVARGCMALRIGQQRRLFGATAR